MKWPFGKKQSPTTSPDSSRYASDPIALFFESYVLKVIGRLSSERELKIDAMKLGDRLGTSAKAWPDAVRETLQLSNTIDVAILDLWFRNSDELAARGHLYEPDQFAREFVDQFFADDSAVDVWPEGALAAAESRIRARLPGWPDA